MASFSEPGGTLMIPCKCKCLICVIYPWSGCSTFYNCGFI
uniref:Uncharacterized protein n=1 Tax=Anguilla anguilla TaxID=7936 RepID=A0A0E9XQB2_ANGAN